MTFALRVGFEGVLADYSNRSATGPVRAGEEPMLRKVQLLGRTPRAAHYMNNDPGHRTKEAVMADKPAAGCARLTGGPVGEPGETQKQETRPPVKEGRTMIQVGKKAPDFIAPAYVKGEFTSVKLSDYLGKWVVLCFYPGDFTFV